jgi:hypothetical protein
MQSLTAKHKAFVMTQAMAVLQIVKHPGFCVAVVKKSKGRRRPPFPINPCFN